MLCVDAVCVDGGWQLESFAADFRPVTAGATLSLQAQAFVIHTVSHSEAQSLEVRIVACAALRFPPVLSCNPQLADFACLRCIVVACCSSRWLPGAGLCKAYSPS